METQYDRLTRRSIEAKQQLDDAEAIYQRAVNGQDGGKLLARRRRDLAMQRYLAIEAERKRADPPPAPERPSG